jgi:hypothetical protein
MRETPDIALQTCCYSLDLGIASFLGDWLNPLARYLPGQLSEREIEWTLTTKSMALSQTRQVASGPEPGQHHCLSFRLDVRTSS